MLIRLLALASVAPSLMVHSHSTGHNASTLEELYGPWVSAATEIASSTESDFSRVVGLRWSAWEAPHWSGAIKPATEKDLQKVISGFNFSGKQDPFIATNGGHGPKTGQGKFTGINVNLANFNTVSIDTTNNLVTLGAGVKLWDVQRGLYDVGKEIQTGNSICPGAIGVTIGAGIGMMTGMYGLMIDTLKSVRVVTAKGHVVKASATENSDLFWAVRGAGVNFGIATEATYGIHDQTNNGNVTAVNFIFTAASNRTVWETLKKFDGNQPAKLSFQAVIKFDRTSNSPIIIVQVWYFGPLTEAQPYLDIFAAAVPATTSSSYLPQTDLYYQSETAGVCDRGNIISANTLGFNQTDVSSYEAHFADLVAFYKANPSFEGESVFQYYSNDVTRQTPQSETAFPWRDIQVWWLTQNKYTNASIGPKVDHLMRGQRTNLQKTSGFPTPHVYFNYAFGDEGAAAWYSAANLPKLRKLKAKWDPDFVFGNGAPLY
ncbi:hypothetical protein N7478_008027 [Penicillium angulare]|uniref:uncharacterized protein n=1 Tax=Penicillium angulare TaxID=116970 RepID=UPI0025417ADE|nr:uncharacterized protein N7478_008027 [Penicillium angulare]KAJ5272902.1 hypothetical protein N7478_008027 [Penicillium angulare]